MKRHFLLALIPMSVYACGGDSAPSRTDSAAGAAATTATAAASETTPTRAAVDACAEIASVASRLRGAEVSQLADSFPAFTGQARRYGCVLTVEGPTSAASVPIVATTLRDSLGAAWQRDSTLVADGPSEMVYGTWRGDVLCLVRTRWGAGRYASTIGCEQLPGRVVPRS